MCKRESKLAGKKRKPDRGETSFFFASFSPFSGRAIASQQRPCPRSIVKNVFCSFLSFAVFRIRSFVPEFLLRSRDTSLLNDSIYVSGWCSTLTLTPFAITFIFALEWKKKKESRWSAASERTPVPVLCVSAIDFCSVFSSLILYSFVVISVSFCASSSPLHTRYTIFTIQFTRILCARCVFFCLFYV